MEKESPDVVVSDYASGAPFDICKEKKIPLVLNYALPGTIASCFHVKPSQLENTSFFIPIFNMTNERHLTWLAADAGFSWLACDAHIRTSDPFYQENNTFDLALFSHDWGNAQKKTAEICAQFFFGGLLLDCPKVEFFGARSGLVRPSEVKRMRIMINIPLLGPLGYRPVADRRNGGTFVLGEWMSYPSLKFARKINHQVDLNIKIVEKGLAGQCLFVLES